jgi:prepilin-type N-terminal cleavage/methylation domain-containing protein
MLKLKLNSSTLVEVIVAMAIISLFIAMYYTYAVKSQREINIKIKIHANILINNEINKLLKDSIFENKEINHEYIVINERVNEISNCMYEVKFVATNRDSLILVERLVLFNSNK